MGTKAKAYVNQENCDGCGACVTVCPIDCWEVTEGKPIFSGQEKCMLCYFCETECPNSVIKLEKVEA